MMEFTCLLLTTLLSVYFLGEYRELDELDHVVHGADERVAALPHAGHPRRGVEAAAQPHNLHGLGEAHVPDQEAGAGGRDEDVVGDHHQPCQTVPGRVHAVEQVALMTLPHTQPGHIVMINNIFPLDKNTLILLRDLHLLVVLPERDDAAGRVRDVRDPGGVGLDAVHAGAGQQVPHTQQPVLRQGGGCEQLL